MKHNLNVEAHLDEELLIRLLDGELEKSLANSAARHLSSCWTCQQRHEQLRQAMVRFVEFEQALTNQPVAAPPRAWAGFQTRLRELAAVVPASRPRPAMEFVRPLGVLALGSALIFSLIPARPVSAKEILEKSEASEESVLKAARNPLVVRQLRVESNRSAASWSLWNAPTEGRFRESWDAKGNANLPGELNAVYSNPGLDARHPLSAANHARWRSSLAKHTESVVEEDGVLRIFTYSQDQPANGKITEAQLWVRTSDWRPIAETFRVAETGESREYKIVETAFRVEPLTSENARIFEEESHPAIEPQHVAVLHHPVELASVRPIEAAPVTEPVVNLADTEVAALALLHKIGADQMESAEVKRGDSAVQVTAYAATEERKDLIVSAVSGVPGAKVAVHLLSESLPKSASEPAPVQILTTPAQRESPMFLKSLIQQAGSPANANQLVVKQMDLLQQLAIELNAVENLADRFPDSVRATLSPASRDQLDALASEHLGTARDLWQAQRDGSGPLLGAMGIAALPANRGSAWCGDWYRPEIAPGKTAWRLEELYARAFTTTTGVAPSDMSEDSLRDEARQLRSKLADLFAEGCLR